MVLCHSHLDAVHFFSAMRTGETMTSNSPGRKSSHFNGGCTFEPLESRQMLSITGGLDHHATSRRFQLSYGLAVSAGTKALFLDNSFSGAVNIYDTHTRRWSQIPLSNWRVGVAATAVDGKAIFAGGWDVYSNLSSTADMIDSRTGATSRVSMPQAFANAGAASIGDEALFFGGTSTIDGSDGATADVYDAVTSHWSTFAIPNLGFDIRTPATIGSKVIFASPSAGEVYDRATGHWAAFPFALHGSIVTAGTKVICVDMTDYELVSSINLDIYDVVTGERTTAKGRGGQPRRVRRRRRQ